jgi:hypothetical protein
MQIVVIDDAESDLSGVFAIHRRSIAHKSG